LISGGKLEVQGSEGGGQQVGQVGGFVGQPLFVGRDRRPERQVTDQLGQQGIDRLP
jgi:hypothetical protein